MRKYLEIKDLRKGDVLVLRKEGREYLSQVVFWHRSIRPGEVILRSLYPDGTRGPFFRCDQEQIRRRQFLFFAS